MSSPFQPSPPARGVSIVRWIAALPAALAAHWVVNFMSAAVLQAVAQWGVQTWGTIWFDALGYVPREMAFVAAGAITAPRSRRITATVLAVLGGALSLLRHIVVQHLAGNRVGAANARHFALESLGLALGVAFICWHVREVCPVSSNENRP